MMNMPFVHGFARRPSKPSLSSAQRYNERTGRELLPHASESPTTRMFENLDSHVSPPEQTIGSLIIPRGYVI